MIASYLEDSLWAVVYCFIYMTKKHEQYKPIFLDQSLLNPSNWNCLFRPVYLSLLFGPVYLSPSIWTQFGPFWLFGPVNLDPSILTRLFGTVYLEPSIWTCIFGPVYLVLSI